MPVAAFDTHKYAKHLKPAGVPDDQVDAQIAALTEALQSGLQELATKQDLLGLKHDTKQNILGVKHDIDQLRQEMKQMIDQLRQEMKQMDAHRNVEMILLKWMLGTTVAGVVGILVRLFFFHGV